MIKKSLPGVGHGLFAVKPIKKGERRGESTEFKKGQHWRPHKPYWEKDWLEKEYIINTAKRINFNG